MSSAVNTWSQDPPALAPALRPPAAACDACPAEFDGSRLSVPSKAVGAGRSYPWLPPHPAASMPIGSSCPTTWYEALVLPGLWSAAPAPAWALRVPFAAGSPVRIGLPLPMLVATIGHGYSETSLMNSGSSSDQSDSLAAETSALLLSVCSATSLGADGAGAPSAVGTYPMGTLQSPKLSQTAPAAPPMPPALCSAPFCPCDDRVLLDRPWNMQP